MKHMNQFLIVGLLFAVSNVAQAAFRFTAWSDTWPGSLEPTVLPGTNRARFQWTLSEMSRIMANDLITPDFHVVPGDFAETSTASTDIAAFTPAFSSWYFAPGNHDTTELGNNNTSVDYGNARFLFVNEFRCPAGIDDNTLGRMCPHIYDWLAGQLTGAPPVVFVLGHKPLGSLSGTQLERDNFWKLLNDHGVLAFLCGHTHVYDVYSDATGPTRQVNTGSAGQSTSLTFLVFDVGDQAVDVSVYRGSENSAFTGGYSFTLEIPQPVYMAHNPSPTDGAAGVLPNTTLSWTPGTNADSHDVYLWVDGAAPQCASSAQTGTTYTPALAYEKTYHWRIDERYLGGTVVPGPVWTFTTRPEMIIAKANGEILINARLLNATSYLNTSYSDNSYEQTQEVLNLANKNGYSTLDHIWTFDVPAGTFLEFHVKAYHSPSTDGDHFVLSFSTDNVNYTEMLTVTKTADDNSEQVYSLPASLKGRVYVKARDTNHTKAAQTLDTLYVDSMSIISSQIAIPEAPKPPVASAGPDQTVTDADRTGSEIVTLDGSASDPAGSTLTFQWYVDGTAVSGAINLTLTDPFEVGTHTATLIVTNADGLTGSDDAIIVVLAPDAGMHIAGITGATSVRGSNQWTALATVTVVDQTGTAVSGASVSGTWSGASVAVVQGTTAADGKVTLSSGTMRGGSSATFTVDNVTHGTLPHNSAADLVTSITILKP